MRAVIAAWLIGITACGSHDAAKPARGSATVGSAGSAGSGAGVKVTPKHVEIRYTLELPAGTTAEARTAAVAKTAAALQLRFTAAKLTTATARADGAEVVVLLPTNDGVLLDKLQAIAHAPGTLALQVVDDNSAFMQAVFKKVGADKAGVPTDEPASRAFLHTDIDRWKAEGGATHTDFYVGARDRDGLVGRQRLEKYLSDLAASDPKLAVPADRELGFERTLPPADDPNHELVWRTYLLERTPALTGADVAHAAAADDQLALDFTPDGAQRFAELTRKIAGKKLAIVIDGTIRSAPIINAEVSGGHAQVVLGGTPPDQRKAEAETLALALTTGAFAAPLLESSMTPVP